MATPSFDSPPPMKKEKKDYVDDLTRDWYTAENLRTSSKSQSVSTFFPVSNYDLFEKSSKSEIVGEKVKLYNLSDVATKLGISDLLKDKSNEDSAAIIVNYFTQDKYSFKVDKEILSMRILPDMYTSTRFRPDIAVYSGKKLVSIIEVHSSPSEKSENKAILSAADIIRFLRNTNITFSEITVFFFPKKDEPSFIASINVKWVNLRFVYTVKRHHTIEIGIDEVKKKLVENLENVPEMPTNISGYLIQLTQDEMEKVCGESKSICTQLNCRRHIMIQCSGYIYKLVYDKDERLCLYKLEKEMTSTPKHFVLPREVSDLIYMYSIVHFNPLKDEQASRCVRTLVQKIKLALDELHKCGFSHNDVRVANIAFNENYDAVLIDLDRSMKINKLHPYFSTPDLGCMYKWIGNDDVLINGKQTDFFQLGWLVLWLLDKQDSYHNRKWEDHDEKFTNDPFIQGLILEGKFNDKYFRKSIHICDVVDFKTFLSSDISD